MQCDQPGIVGPCFDEGLIPLFRLAAGIGENQGAGVGVDDVDHLGQQFESEVASPGEALHCGGDDGINRDVLIHFALHQPPFWGFARVCACCAQQRPHGRIQVTHRRGKAPRPQSGMPAPQPR